MRACSRHDGKCHGRVVAVQEPGDRSTTPLCTHHRIVEGYLKVAGLRVYRWPLKRRRREHVRECGCAERRLEELERDKK